MATIANNIISSFPADHPLRLWVEQELKRSMDDVKEFKVTADVERDYKREIEIGSAWQLFITGNLHYRATFNDGSTAHKEIEKHKDA